MFKLFTIILALLAPAYAEISLDDLSKKPTGRTKDFMIWQYLNQNITPQQADLAYSQVKSTKNNKIFYRYARKTDDKRIKRKAKCKKEKNLLDIIDSECLKTAITIKKSIKYTNKQRDQLIARLTDDSLICMLNIQNEQNIQKAYIKYPPDKFLHFFNRVGYRYRNKNLNITLDNKFIESLSCEDEVSNFIKIVVNTKSLYNLQKSLLDINGNIFDSMSNFFLGLNHLNYGNKGKAIEFFRLSRDKALSPINRDKSIFWLYQVTKDKKYLTDLVASFDINIYTLFAKDMLDVETTNYFTDTKDNASLHSLNLQNPYHWDKIYKEITVAPKDSMLKLLDKYNQKNMKPVQAYILQKASDYKVHAYLMPYDKYLKNLSVDDKALVYALMRQESQYIPSALSCSFAQGLMQMMPFVTKAISKEIKHPVSDLNQMFEPEHNLRYARHHLRWMQRSLYHPLFIAYAYNGGIGFFKRYLLSNKFNKGNYEPYLSMEMMSNTQSREYGKKVLANYVMYKKILGEEVSIIHLFDSLMIPKKTDRFRVLK